MPSWSELLEEIEAEKDFENQIGYIREKKSEYLTKIHEITGRNVIAYYSAFLSNKVSEHISINDDDKNAFMQAVHKMDKSKGLDLILHTPGGDIAATESIIDYLHSIFEGDIRAIIPQMAMSAGTMIALSCNSIMMGKQSNLGPVDPQMGGVACGAVLSEFETAKADVANNPSSLGLWQVIISKYPPTFLKACQNANEWSQELVTKWMEGNGKKAEAIEAFADHQNSKSHNRHISMFRCKELGLNIEDMEDNQELQDAILSLHHCYTIFFDKTIVVKSVVNQLGAGYRRVHRENIPTQKDE